MMMVMVMRILNDESVRSRGHTATYENWLTYSFLFFHALSETIARP